jgi:hypothetical protein
MITRIHFRIAFQYTCRDSLVLQSYSIDLVLQIYTICIINVPEGKEINVPEGKEHLTDLDWSEYNLSPPSSLPLFSYAFIPPPLFFLHPNSFLHKRE